MLAAPFKPYFNAIPTSGAEIKQNKRNRSGIAMPRKTYRSTPRIARGMADRALGIGGTGSTILLTTPRPTASSRASTSVAPFKSKNGATNTIPAAFPTNPLRIEEGTSLPAISPVRYRTPVIPAESIIAVAGTIRMKLSNVLRWRRSIRGLAASLRSARDATA
jgi:hypothetical protein